MGVFLVEEEGSVGGRGEILNPGRLFNVFGNTLRISVCRNEMLIKKLLFPQNLEVVGLKILFGI